MNALEYTGGAYEGDVDEETGRFEARELQGDPDSFITTMFSIQHVELPKPVLLSTTTFHVARYCSPH